MNNEYSGAAEPSFRKSEYRQSGTVYRCGQIG